MTASAARAGLDGCFAHKVCLNLDRRPERWARMQARFAELGMSNVVRFSAIDGETIDVPSFWQGTRGAYGCLQSNLAVIRQALANRWPDVLLFEDDVVFDAELSTKLPQFMAEVPADWDMLFFGGMHREAPRRIAAHVLKLAGSTSTYAYAIRSTLYREFIDVHAASPEPIDVRNRRLQQAFNCYCFFPHLAWVEGGPSDTQGRPVNPWWLRESLILGGRTVDDLQARTLVVIAHPPSPDATLAGRNLAFTAAAYGRLLPHASLAIVGNAAGLDRSALPGAELVSLDRDGRVDAGRCFNEGIARYGRGRDFYVCAHRDIVPTWDMRAHLLKCLDHDLASSAREWIDLTEDDSRRLAAQQPHLNPHYVPRPRRGVCDEGCVVTNAAFHRSGGWRELDDADGDAPLWFERAGPLSTFDSPALGLRLFDGAAMPADRRRAC